MQLHTSFSSSAKSAVSGRFRALRSYKYLRTFSPTLFTSRTLSIAWSKAALTSFTEDMATSKKLPGGDWGGGGKKPNAAG